MVQLISLKQNRDFVRAYKKGTAYSSPLVIAYVRKNYLGRCRYGITATKKIGGAVQRNRCRRIIREAYRQLAKEIDQKASYDFVFVARVRTARASSKDVLPMMRKQLKTAGILI